MGLTKSQIRYNINYLENLNVQNDIELKHYKDALNYAKKLSDSLKKTKTNLSNTQDELKKTFTINNKPADKGKINETIKEIDTIIKDLDNKIIYSINNNINSLNNDIQSNKYEIYYWYDELEKAEY